MLKVRVTTVSGAIHTMAAGGEQVTTPGVAATELHEGLMQGDSHILQLDGNLFFMKHVESIVFFED